MKIKIGLFTIYVILIFSGCGGSFKQTIESDDTVTQLFPTDPEKLAETQISPINKPEKTMRNLIDSPPIGTILPDQEQEKIGNILFIFGHGFDFRHYEGTRRTLEKAGYRIFIASNTSKMIEGAIIGHGYNRNSPINLPTPFVKADLLLDEIEITDYDAVVFISDIDLLSNPPPELQQLVSHAKDREIVLAAQEFGIYILAEAGLLKGKKVTADPLICQEMETNYNALCTLVPVQRDSGIVTADPTMASVSFARAILAEIDIKKHK